MELCPSISECAAFVCQSKESCAKGYGTDLFSGRADSENEVYPLGSPAAIAVETAASAAADHVFYAARGLSTTSGDTEAMTAMTVQVSSRMEIVLTYEEPALQAKARAVLPTEEGGGTISQRTAEIVASGGYSEEEGLARALLR